MYSNDNIMISNNIFFYRRFCLCLVVCLLPLHWSVCLLYQLNSAWNSNTAAESKWVTGFA